MTRIAQFFGAHGAEAQVRPSSIRDRAVLAGLGIFSGLVYLALARLSEQFNWGEGYADRPILAYLVQYGLLFCLYAAAGFWILRRRLEDRVVFWLVVGFGLAFRLIILPSQQIQEDDVYRYLWDGKVFAHGINPYAYAPQDVTDFKYIQIRDPRELRRRFSPDDLRNLETLYRLKFENPTALLFQERVNHPKVPTIYPPLAQWVLRLAHHLRPDSIFALRLVFLAFDASALVFLTLTLRTFNRNPNLSLWYFWSPLVIKETFNSTHLDIIGIACLCACVFFWARRWLIAATLALALSVLGKLYPVIVLPLYLLDASRPAVSGGRRNWNEAALQALLFAVTVFMFYLPFLDIGRAAFQGLQTYAVQWQRNDSVFALLLYFYRGILGLRATGAYVIADDLGGLCAKLTAGAILFGAMLGLARRGNGDALQPVRASFVMIALAFILSPVQNPWYLCWVVPFLCFFPVRAWIFLTGLIGLYYLEFYFDYQEARQYIPWVVWVEYTPFYALLGWNLWRWKRVPATAEIH
jgi:hypothetical protein